LDEKKRKGNSTPSTKKWSKSEKKHFKKFGGTFQKKNTEEKGQKNMHERNFLIKKLQRSGASNRKKKAQGRRFTRA